VWVRLFLHLTLGVGPEKCKPVVSYSAAHSNYLGGVCITWGDASMKPQLRMTDLRKLGALIPVARMFCLGIVLEVESLDLKQT
jgi:hypothetical protein